MVIEQLSLATLPALADGARPLVDPRGIGVGIVHLGLGAFHRAHQAVYTEEAMAAAGGDWGVCGVSQRSATAVNQLKPQDGLYSVLQRHPEGTHAQVVGAIRQLVFAQADPDTLTRVLAAPATQVVSLTVTEKGYRRDGYRLRTDDPQVAADLAGSPPATAIGQLVRGLSTRMATEVGPVTVLSCDNLPANGTVVRELVTDFCSRIRGGDALLDWVTDNVAFPNTVVDRIVPATIPADRSTAAGLLGLHDEGVVIAEPFRQWVIEDTFAGDRPAWERAGAILTPDAAPYETIKLRVLNGAHSTIAYLGGLAGHAYVADAMSRLEMAELLARLMAEEVAPTLTVPTGFDLPAYQASVLDRFANPALAHRTSQIATDGSQKLPQRLLDTVRERLAADAEPRLTALAIAGWMRYVSAQTADDGAPLQVTDPLGDRLRALTAHATSPAAVVDALLTLREVFGTDLPASTTFREMLVSFVEQLQADGAASTIHAALNATCD